MKPNIDYLKLASFYRNYRKNVLAVQKFLGRPLTLAEKILYSHMPHLVKCERGSYAFFNPDRVAMQDATAQMALLQFMTTDMTKVAVPTTVHCDHLIQAEHGAGADLIIAKKENAEVYEFLKDVCQKYGIGFWKPGSGIIHQVILENYALPGQMMVGTDSHTPNAGGLGMIAIGVGGADAVDVMTNTDWELKMPKLIGVNLTGKMNGWTSAKDVILKLAGILTVKGGTDCIIEYLGSGASTISATGKATICNMGAEIGATTSIFPYDVNMKKYLRATRDGKLVELLNTVSEFLVADPEVYQNPEKYFDRLIEINLDELEPYINGPFTPDKAWPISEFANAVKENGYPDKIEVGLIGSCTNSSYQDLSRSASIADQAFAWGIKALSDLTVTPGSETIRFTTDRDNLLDSFRDIGGLVLANACGPCIGQWKRHTNGDTMQKNTILTSYNRNFAKRNDGNVNTHAFVASPEIVTAMTIAGSLSFNPIKDYLTDKDGNKVKFSEPVGVDLPPDGFEVKDLGYLPPLDDGSNIEVNINPNSKRLQKLEPFNPFEKEDFINMKVLIKAKGKCTTDHISMAGPWLEFRGHLDNISDNMLIGALNAFNEKVNCVKNQISGEYDTVPKVQRYYKANDVGSIIVAEENYGEGSSREHAAMEPRYLGVKMVLAKSFARIHETNLKKQGLLALKFGNPDDYEKIREDDEISIFDFDTFAVNFSPALRVQHSDGTEDVILTCHTYNEEQIEWFLAGSALNLMRENSMQES